MVDASNSSTEEQDIKGHSQSEADYSLFGLKEPEPLAVRIKAARENMGLSQRAFAEKIGITQAQLCHLETKYDTRPTRKTLKALAPFLATPYSTLLVQAGYSGVITPQEEYYSFSGEPIDPVKTVEEIFRKDPDFLKCLSDFSQFGTIENIAVLKILIQTMKITEGENLNEDLLLLRKRFQYLKEYIVGVLSVPAGH